MAPVHQCGSSLPAQSRRTRDDGIGWRRRRLALAILAGLLVLAAAPAAEAHRLRVFATVDGGIVSGYGFFAGGGRPARAHVRAVTSAGVTVFSGPTGPDGRFAFPITPPVDLTLSIETGDGHVATMTLRAAAE